MELLKLPKPSQQLARSKQSKFYKKPAVFLPNKVYPKNLAQNIHYPQKHREAKEHLLCLDLLFRIHQFLLTQRFLDVQNISHHLLFFVNNEPALQLHMRSSPTEGKSLGEKGSNE